MQQATKHMIVELRDDYTQTTGDIKRMIYELKARMADYESRQARKVHFGSPIATTSTSPPPPPPMPEESGSLIHPLKSSRGYTNLDTAVLDNHATMMSELAEMFRTGVKLKKKKISKLP